MYEILLLTNNEKLVLFDDLRRFRRRRAFFTYTSVTYNTIMRYSINAKALNSPFHIACYLPFQGVYYCHKVKDHTIFS